MLLPYCLLAPLRLKKHPQKKCMCLVGVWKPRASRTSEWRRMRAGKSKIGIKGPPGFMGLKCAWERKIREIRQREREREQFPMKIDRAASWPTAIRCHLTPNSCVFDLGPHVLSLSLSLTYSPTSNKSLPPVNLCILSIWDLLSMLLKHILTEENANDWLRIYFKKILTLFL